MKISHIAKSALKTNPWNGGTTTELYIFPMESSFAERNYLFRISTATVEQEQSVFTKFNGYSRELMVLKGELIITHVNQYQKSLKTFEVDSFEGDWETTAIGKVTDFNIIYRGSVLAKIEQQLITKSDTQIENLSVENATVCIYVYEGNGEYLWNGELKKLHENDCLLLEYTTAHASLVLRSENSMNIIIARTWH